MTESELLCSRICNNIRTAMLDYHILKSVAESPTTGYKIFKNLRKERIKITRSLIYAKLNKLREQGYISCRIIYGRINRKQYKLTKKGRNLLKKLNVHIKEAIEGIK